MNLPKIIPALLFDNLEAYINQINKWSHICNQVHIDVCEKKITNTIDTPNIMDILEKSKHIKIQKNIHLMTTNYKKILEILIQRRDIKFIYLHLESIDNEILYYSKKIVPTFRIEDDVENYTDVLQKNKNIQIMGVNIGAQGQTFNPKAILNIKKARKINPKISIHLDGGINPNIKELIKNEKIDVLNIGSYLNDVNNKKEFIQKINLFIN